MPHSRSGAAPGLRIWLLNGFRVAIGPRQIHASAWLRRPAKTIVKLLAVEPTHRLHRDVIVERIWPELAPAAALNAFHKSLHAARRALEPDLPPGAPSAYLRTDGELLALQASAGRWVDVDAFRAQATRALRDPSVERCRRAVALYPGDLLPEDRYEEWSFAAREELQGRFTDLLRLLAQLELAEGRPAEAAECLRRVLSVDPLAEDAHAGLMRLHAMAAGRHLAVQQYERLRDALARELGTAPGAEVDELYRDILAGRVPPAHVPAPLA